MTGRTRMALAAAVAALLGLAPLADVYADWGWVLPIGGATLTVAVVLAVLRRSGAPAALEPAVAAMAVLGYLTGVFAPDDAWLRVVPSLATFDQLGALERQGFTDIDHLAAPVPTHQGLLMLGVIGGALVAFAVDALAVRARRPALAGLPLLALFAVPSAVSPGGVSWVAFAVSAVGWLMLLRADSRDRVGRWGRAPVAHGGRVGATPLAATGRRIGVAALGVALVVPPLVPGLSHRLIGQHGSGGGGSSTVTTYNPIVRIRDQLNDQRVVPLLRYRTDDSAPDYLRMTTLDRFDGDAWTSSAISGDERSRVSRGLPDLPGPGRTVHTQVHVLGLDVHWMPLPYPPTRIQVDGDWRFDRPSETVFSTRSSTEDLDYTVTSRHPTPAQAALQDAGPADGSLQPYLALPRLPGLVTQTADAWTAGAATAYDKAAAIQRHLSSAPFRYDQSVPAQDGTSAIVQFLRSQQGFCEQYAATMAVMARYEGIPARVAVGFTPGTKQADGSYLVTSHDAHAWPELWFEGFGWLRFEPTPVADGRSVQPAYTQPSTQPGAGGQSATPPPSVTAPSAQPSAPAGQNAKLDQLDRTDSAGGPAAARGGGVPWQPVLVGALVLLVLLGPAGARLLIRRRRWAGAVDGPSVAAAAWLELHDAAADAGLAWPVSDTPRRAARRLADDARLDGEARAALERVTGLAERAAYAPEPPAAHPGPVRADVQRVQAGLRSSASRWRRLRAWLAPASAMRWVHALAGRTAAVVDAVDAAPDRAGWRLRRALGR